MSDVIEHISEKPWSDYTKADYSLEQWHAACLIHLHDGPPSSKSECKLPIKTPSGALNRNGVHAAASVLAGGRGGVHAPPDKKASAAKALRGAYSQLGEKPPPSIAMTNLASEDLLEHFGTKGMKWGVRSKSNSGSSTDLSKADAAWKEKFITGGAADHAVRKTNDDVGEHLKSINTKWKSELGFDPRVPGKHTEPYNREIEHAYNQALKANMTAYSSSPSGKRMDMIYSVDRNQFGFRLVDPSEFGHADASFDVILIPKRDADGFIIGFEIKETSMTQTSTTGENFIDHHGVKGQKWGVRRRTPSRVTASSPNVKKNFRSSDFRTTQPLRKRKVSQLSNKQLEAINKRMNLEKNYKKLNPSAFTKGHETVKGMLGALGTATLAYGYLTKTQSGKNLVNKGEKILLNRKAARMAVKLGY